MTGMKRAPGERWQQRGEVLAAVFVCAAVLMLLVPLPAVLLDLGMLLNICFSLLVILIVLQARNTLEFTAFPTMLLLVTVFGLALNVSSTRLILTQGAAFDGRIVRAFGSFVVGASGVAGYLIGLIIFTIIIAVQFVVITKGSTRVAEVAARFALDALPARQMAIDAEYHAGLLTEAQARRRKQELQLQSDFYGAMDGASKFVSGSVRVAILITLINLGGGLIMGVSVHGEPLAAAAQTYVSLTIGDGLVTQLPALLIATATGIVVTRAVSGASFGSDAARQLSASDRPFYLTGGFLAVLALLPGFPPHLLLPLAAAVAALGYAVGRARGGPAGAPDAADEAAGAAGEAGAAPEPLALELGYALVAMTEGRQGRDLLDRIGRLRARLAEEWAAPVPQVLVTDNLQLAPAEYALKIRGAEVSRGRCRMGDAAGLVARLAELLRAHAAQVRAEADAKADAEAGAPAAAALRPGAGR